MRVLLLLCCLAAPAGATPVILPDVQGLPIAKPAQPMPPNCLSRNCPREA
ncbi:hypothetical protein MWU52_00795 [Jannaschia sp. S6380]|nr:hypothetical protein [Jannaschia sp. S6380]MCK0166080.1 hypothetical protein [Jannaschia sp. S6380]